MPSTWPGWPGWTRGSSPPSTTHPPPPNPTPPTPPGGPRPQPPRAFTRARDSLVRARTHLINHARGLVKTTAARLPSCSAASFHTKTASAVPQELLPALSPILATIGSLTQSIQAYDRQIQQLALDHYPETRLLRNVPGVGTVTSLPYILTLEDPQR